MTKRTSVEHNVPIPMRDGTILHADIYRPAAAGRYPVLVERVAYELVSRCQANGEFCAGHGYVFVGQSVRGRFWSEGEFWPGRDDAWGANRDGYDTIEWAGTQPWSNGNVGMVDGSYSGFTMYVATPTRPPHLKALYAREGLSDLYRDFFYRGGVHLLAIRNWAMRQTLIPLQHESAPEGMVSQRRRLDAALDEMDSWVRHLPLRSVPPLEGLADWYFDVLDHPEDGPFWWPTSLSTKYQEVDTPILHLGGWYDAFLDSTLRCYQGIRARGKSAHCRESQRLVVGPWVHGPANVGAREVGILDYGPEATTYTLDEERLRWYDHWLKGEENGAMDGPRVRVFLMGDNRWVDLDDWPPPGVEGTRLYLHDGAGKSAPTPNGGCLSFVAPGLDEGPDSYAYDPEDPVPSIGASGPQDYAPIEGRLLTYTTDLLQEDLVVMGPVKAVLHALSTAPDTDWIARLCDVWPDGRSVNVCSGALRARYRESLEREVLLVPGRICSFEIPMSSTAQVFKAGHRLRLHVTSSDFANLERNLNTGGINREEIRGQVAINTVFHDALRASYVELPVVKAVSWTSVTSDLARRH